MASPVLQFKRGALANLPGLRAGEPALTTDSYDLYVGIDSTTNGNKFFGSHRYWTKETTTVGAALNLVEGTSNGSNYVALKSPDSVASNVTFVLPGTDGTNGQVLKTDGSGNLSFVSIASTFAIAGDTGSDTFTTGATLTFSGGEGIDTAITDDTITISAEDASDTNKGVASFNSGDFTVTSGNVVLADSATGAVQTINGTASEIEVSRTNSTVTIALPDNVVVGSSLTVTGALDAQGDVTLGDSGSDLITVVGVATFTTSNVYIDNSLFVGGLEVNGGASIGLDVTTRNLSASGISTFTGAIDANGGADIAGHTELDTVNVGVALTSASLTLASGASITAILDEDNFVSDSATAVPTQQSTKAYVDNSISGIDLTVSTAADSGTGSVSTSQTLTVSGTANEIETAASGQSITIGLPNDVTIGNNLTVTGNLYVNGSTTQVNTSSLTVEDRTIELGLVNGSAPSSATTWDLGVLFNYHATSAKKSAVVWEQGDARFKFASEVSDGGGTDNDSPQITFTAFAPIEIGALWVNDCAGQSQVISCASGERKLENITVDAGTF